MVATAFLQVTFLSHCAGSNDMIHLNFSKGNVTVNNCEIFSLVALIDCFEIHTKKNTFDLAIQVNMQCTSPLATKARQASDVFCTEIPVQAILLVSLLCCSCYAVTAAPTRRWTWGRTYCPLWPCGTAERDLMSRSLSRHWCGGLGWKDSIAYCGWCRSDRGCVVFVVGKTQFGQGQLSPPWSCQILETHLWKAAIYEMLSRTKRFVPCWQQDMDSCTPLILAATRGYVDIVQLLASADCDLDQRNTEGAVQRLVSTKHSCTYCLNTAACSSWIRIVFWSIRPSRLSAGRTALMEASIGNHVSVAQLLVRFNCHINVMDKHGYTALSDAVCGGQRSMVDLLLQGASIWCLARPLDMRERRFFGSMSIGTCLLNTEHSIPSCYIWDLTFDPVLLRDRTRRWKLEDCSASDSKFSYL